VVCGGVIVHPGDMIVADEIGVAVVPAQEQQAVYDLARAQADREQATRERIAQGRSFEQLLEEFGRI
jgi:3-hexulose-6-phosphate synthase/6-phospho-3-hexuloisomerase